MSLFVVSRRRVVYYQPSLGASTVVYVPSSDQVQTLKDAAGTAAAITNKGSAGHRLGPLLYRVAKGQRVLYGHLPLELRERRERLKVWLPEDMAPVDADAFFYVFTPQVVVHGVRERTDEGKLAWRTAQLVLPASEEKAELKALETVLADFMFAHQDQHVCLAVANDLKVFRSVQALATPLGLTPVPFSTLKSQPGVSPLYSHLNFTWLYILVMLAGAMAVLAVAAFFFMKKQEIVNIRREISDLEAQIQVVQINPRVGHIRQAMAVVNEIKTAFPVSPTSILAAAGEAMVSFGQMVSIEVGEIADERLQQLGLSVDENVVPVHVQLTEAADALLVDQEHRAQEILQNTPWLRKIVRYGATGKDTSLIALMQVKEPAAIMGGDQ